MPSTGGVTLRGHLGAGVRTVCRAVGRPGTWGWRDYSRLFLVSDAPQWVIEWESREVGAIAASLGIPTPPRSWLNFATRQAVFYGSHLDLFLGRFPPLGGHRLGAAYFHGRPGSGPREFDIVFERLRAQHERIARLQVSHSEMRDVVLASGVDPAKVFQIPIGVNLSYFPQRTAESRANARRALNLPTDVPVVGSFQKDGVGWGEGLEPKHVKGPDTLLDTIDRVRGRIRDLHVVLSGPARGFVKQGLGRLGVPYRHEYVQAYPDLWRLYHACDVCLVTSRQEGGPKAVLEAMACGVPVVTTRVGQAMDLVRDGVNGWMVAVDDVDSLAACAAPVLEHGAAPAVLAAGRLTAEANTYDAQRPMWRQFFDGFVDAADR